MSTDYASSAFLASPTQNGMMSKEDKAKLDSISPGGGGTLADAYVAGGGNAGSDNQLGGSGASMSVPVELFVNNASALHVRDSGGSDGDVALGTGSNGDGQIVVKDKSDLYSVILGGGVDQAITAQDGETVDSPGDNCAFKAGNGTGSQTGGNMDLYAGGAESLLALYANPPRVRLGIRGLADHIDYTLDPDGGGFPIMRLASIPSSYIQWGANMVLRAGSGVWIPYTNGTDSLGYTNKYWRTSFVRLPVVKKGADLTAAATITPTDGIHALTGATNISTIAVPSDFVTGTIRFLCTGAVNFVTGGNINNALSVTDGVAEATYDGALWWMK